MYVVCWEGGGGAEQERRAVEVINIVAVVSSYRNINRFGLFSLQI